MNEPSEKDEISLDELTLKAREGSSDAQCELALRHLSSGKTDFQEIAYWLKQSADQGNSRAAFKMALFYAIGRGVKKDKNKALDYYQKFVESDDHESLIESNAEDYKALTKALGLNTQKEGERIKLRSAKSETFSATAARRCLYFFERFVKSPSKAQARIFINIALASLICHSVLLSAFAVLKNCLPQRKVTIQEIALELLAPQPEAAPELPKTQEPPSAKAIIPAEVTAFKPSEEKENVPIEKHIARPPNAIKEMATSSPQTGVDAAKTSDNTSIKQGTIGTTKNESPGQLAFGNGSPSAFDNEDWGFIGKSNGKSGGSKTGSGGGGDDGHSLTIIHNVYLSSNGYIQLFSYQNTFKPESLPEGEERQWLTQKWKDHKIDENLQIVEELIDKMESKGLAHSPQMKTLLLAIVTSRMTGDHEKYRKKLVELSEAEHGILSDDTARTEAILEETTGHPSLEKMDSLKRAMTFVLDKKDLPTALIHRTFANTYAGHERFDEAEREFEKSLEIMERLPKSDLQEEEVALTKLSLGSMYVQTGRKPAQARELLQSAIAYCDKQKDEKKKFVWLRSMCLLQLGDLDIKEGRKYDAKSTFEQVSAVLPSETGMSVHSIWRHIIAVTHYKLSTLNN